jgi:hypothetical protein
LLLVCCAGKPSPSDDFHACDSGAHERLCSYVARLNTLESSSSEVIFGCHQLKPSAGFFEFKAIWWDLHDDGFPLSVPPTGMIRCLTSCVSYK